MWTYYIGNEEKKKHFMNKTLAYIPSCALLCHLAVNINVNDSNLCFTNKMVKGAIFMKVYTPINEGVEQKEGYWTPDF